MSSKKRKRKKERSWIPVIFLLPRAVFIDGHRDFGSQDSIDATHYEQNDDNLSITKRKEGAGGRGN